MDSNRARRDRTMFRCQECGTWIEEERETEEDYDALITLAHTTGVARCSKCTEKYGKIASTYLRMRLTRIFDLKVDTAIDPRVWQN